MKPDCWHCGMPLNRPRLLDDALRRHLNKCHYCADLLRALAADAAGLGLPARYPAFICARRFHPGQLTGPGSRSVRSTPGTVFHCREERTEALDGRRPAKPWSRRASGSRQVAGRESLGAGSHPGFGGRFAGRLLLLRPAQSEGPTTAVQLVSNHPHPPSQSISATRTCSGRAPSMMPESWPRCCRPIARR